MKKIYDWVVNIPKDKLLHILVIVVITMVSTLIFKWCGCGKLSPFYGFGVGFVFGIGKEIYDEAKGRESEAMDWAADFVTLIFVTAYSWLMMI